MSCTRLLHRILLPSAKPRPTFSLFSPISTSFFSTTPSNGDLHRNIGISAHIDSGKTTLTERILYYTGRISSIHDVRGKDGVGAKMDSMELEREKGITIQSAATFCMWKDSHVNIIDTPGHVDFTIEVERALRVLDGAIMILCGVSGVQSQSLTVDRQMKRYEVPRLAFINKLDRQGSNPFKVIDDIRSSLGLNASAVQIPIGLEDGHEGVVDLVEGKCITFKGERGREVVESADIPSHLQSEVEEKLAELIEKLADVDDEIGELFLMDQRPSVSVLKSAIRRCTLERTFVPVFMGSAYKNKGVQPLLDGVIDYLPSPTDIKNVALDLSEKEKVTEISGSPEDPLLALAFKLEETPFGQLTYVRIYQGRLRKGQMVYNVNDQCKKVKIPRIVRMHSDDMEDIQEAQTGDVVALFGIDCKSMDTFSDNGIGKFTLSSMFVPEPVMSLAVKPETNKMQDNFTKALRKFTKEDPTLRVKVDLDTNETVLSGMGELHLEVYVERLLREYEVSCQTGAPSVNYKETIGTKVGFDHIHKKQTGGSGQYARVSGYVEPLPQSDDPQETLENEYLNYCVGTNIPPEFYTSCEKGTHDALVEGPLVGGTVQSVRVVLEDGASHAVDSSDMAFRTCMGHAVRNAMRGAKPKILEPVMKVQVDVPSEFQGAVVAGLNRRQGMILGSEMSDSGVSTTLDVEVPLANMFGYSTELRSGTQGKGEFTMEYATHMPVNRTTQEELIKKYQEERNKKLEAA